VTYKASAFLFMASSVCALAVVIGTHVVSNNRMRSDRQVVQTSELTSVQLSRVRLVISNVK
jgi:hypothetical protein